MKILKKIESALKSKILAIQCNSIANQLKVTLNQHQDSIPVFLVSYNNGVYIDNSVKQLNRLNVIPIIFDNASSDKKTIDLLKSIHKENKARIIYSKKNWGHLIGFLDPIYKLLPNVFAYSDPDLEFNPELRINFLEELAQLTLDYDVFKAGFALALLNDDEIINGRHNVWKRKPIFFKRSYSIRDWEKKFWKFKIEHPTLEIYHAPIDTTFAVYRKSNYSGDFFDAVRVAGKFEAIHMPWFPSRDLLTSEDKENYLKMNISSTWVK